MAVTGKKLHASPTKDFFVRMITKDIRLSDCILDLLDNSIDGANRILASTPPQNAQRYLPFRVVIDTRNNRFSITDNCGGIPLNDAIDYAFHFGRRQDTPRGADKSIGLYGIGMKRAILKLGKNISIRSCTNDDCFITRIDVDDWIKQEDWDFNLDEADPLDEFGTEVIVESLYPSVGEDISSSAFVNQLKKAVARDYSIFIENGLLITVNDDPVPAYEYKLLESEDYKPVKYHEDDGNVRVEVYAGLAAPPPEDIDPDLDIRASEYFGWFVICNNRVVIPADKSDRTVWGVDDIPRFHPQFNGFMGILHFQSDDPALLPWTTTKREVDLNDPLYRRGVVRMKKATRPFIEYTNQRKQDLEAARQKETSAVARSLSELKEHRTLETPIVGRLSNTTLVSIQYRKPKEDVRKIARALGQASMSNREVGEKTFDFFLDNEVE